MNLNERWLAGYQGLAAKALWQLIESKYSEPHRYYHTLEHLSHCFNELDQLHFLSNNEHKIISLSIWFHDLVYDTHSSYNEESSATLFRDAARQLNISSAISQQVQDNILFSKHCELEIAVIPNETSYLFLDIDLSILGQSSEHYLDYASKIRKEFFWVPENVYNVKRADVLKGFLDKELIYHTPEFWARYEHQARRNIEEEISRLQK